MDMQKIGLLGFGTMGAGIAQLIAQSGRDVLVLETAQERIDAGMRFLSEFLATGVARGKLTEEDSNTIRSRVHGVLKVEELADAQLVIEAVTENPDAKKSLFAKVSSIVSADVPILTNTSALSVTDLATSVDNRGRFAGLHFFNPAPLMKIIEVVKALETDDKTIDTLVAFVESLGKEPVVVKDRPGFLVNSLLMPYLNDVIQAYDEDLATAEDIDIAIRLGLGHKLGPLELLDLIGLDVHNHATMSAYQATLDPKFAPPPLLRQMVAAGHLGNKNGKGFRTDGRKTA
ncbi:3-hydroxyacyl-CoA dehydrogenase family protein [Arthrobacter sp. NPDC080031]|uniref:3-hydroxyacyl-CoA dehydrogenase family protein n=1 Tax=Arthrobacter sp. NPDC080031 TaxID=3155918 RepID=UPI003450932E